MQTVNPKTCILKKLTFMFLKEIVVFFLLTPLSSKVSPHLSSPLFEITNSQDTFGRPATVPRDTARSTQAGGAARLVRTHTNRDSASALRAANQRKRCAAAYKPICCPPTVELLPLLLLLRCVFFATLLFSASVHPTARHRITALTRAELHPPRRPNP